MISRDEETDLRVRIAVYAHLVETGVAPDPGALSARLGSSVGAVLEALERLAAAHILVLHPDTRALWMAMPFSAVPTGFRVHMAHGAWWGNCAWDALGIAAMLAGPARIEAACADCEAVMEVEIDGRGASASLGGQPVTGTAVVHFAVPARHWWDDIGFT